MKELIRSIIDRYDAHTKANIREHTALRLLGRSDSAFIKAVMRKAERLGVPCHIAGYYLPGIPTVIDVETAAIPENLRHLDDVDNVMHNGASSVSKAILEVLEAHIVDGKHVAIVGRGHAVKKLPEKLLERDATVTVCHSATVDVYKATQAADILVVATPPDAMFDACVCNKELIIDVGNTLDKSKLSCKVCDGRDIGPLTTSILLYMCT